MKTDLPAETQDAISHVLAAGGFASAAEAAWEVSMTVALSKVSKYERECEHFRRKYGESLYALQARLAAAAGREDFDEEDDVADWEFAEEALKEWTRRLELLRDVA